MWLKPHGSHSSWSVISLCWLSFGLHGVGHAVWFFLLLANCRRRMKGSWNAISSTPMKAQISRLSMGSGASQPSWSLRMARRKMLWSELSQRVPWLHASRKSYRYVSDSISSGIQTVLRATCFWQLFIVMFLCSRNNLDQNWWALKLLMHQTLSKELLE